MKRNLLYYVYPRQCSMLAYNLYLLCKYHSIFNGRKIVFAVEDKEDNTLVDQLHLTWMFNDTHDIRPYELIMVPKGQDEGACLSKMLEMVQSDNPDEISFYAHAKDTSSDAVSKSTVGEISDWVEVLYKNNLSDPSQVDSVLHKYPCAGTLQYTARHPLDSYWSYGGNFFWFNHRELFRKKWRDYTSPIDEYISDKFGDKEVYNFCEDWASMKKGYSVVKNWDPSRVTIVTTCKNRWEFLRQSLPTWLNKGFREIIVVDWSSDLPVASNIEALPRGSNCVTVVRVEGESIFNGGMARNTGTKHVKSDYVLFIDSDMVMKNWELSEGLSLVSGRFYHGPHNIPPFGTSLVRLEDFKKINGYSEFYTSYGWEDNDLYNRLEASGIKRHLYDERMVEHIDHSDDLRSQYRDQRGRKLHETVWANRDLDMWTPKNKQEEKVFTRQEFHI